MNQPGTYCYNIEVVQDASRRCGSGRSRTYSGASQQIYSLSRLSDSGVYPGKESGADDGLAVKGWGAQRFR